MIKSIEIDKLFGTFDYQINLPEAGDYLILTGPNGYGKTTILNIIEALSRGNLLFFFKIPFREIRISYYDNNRLRIKSVSRKEKGRLSANLDSEIGRNRELRFSFITGKKTEILNISFSDVKFAREELKWTEYRWTKSPEDEFNSSTSNVSSREKETDDDLNVLIEIVKNDKKDNFLVLINSENINSKFILAQRLYELNKNDSSYQESIIRIAEDFKWYLRNNYISFLKNSQSRDSHFIETLMSGNEEISERDYEQRVEGLKGIILNAKKYDLLADFKFPEYNASKSFILKCFIDDAENKLKTYQKPLGELNLFDSLLKEKMLVNKTIIYSQNKGLRIVSANNENTIPLERLSSGEKNEMVMLHDFIFNLPDNSILMIDEPEISLHVAWQQDFLTDIKKIAEQKNLHVIIATHSPQIIDGRWDDCYDLFEATEKESES